MQEANSRGQAQDPSEMEYRGQVKPGWSLVRVGSVSFFPSPSVLVHPITVAAA